MVHQVRQVLQDQQVHLALWEVLGKQEVRGHLVTLVFKDLRDYLVQLAVVAVRDKRVLWASQDQQEV